MNNQQTIATKSIASSSGFKSLIVIVMGALAILVIAWMNTGVFTYAMPYISNYVRYGAYFTWFGLAVISNKWFIKIFLVQSWPLLLFYAYMLFISVFIDTSLETYIISIRYLIIAYSVFLYYFNSKYRQFLKFLCGFLIGDIIIVGINTYIQLQLNPVIARFLAAGYGVGERRLGWVPYGVGSYGYFYSLVAIVLLMGFLFLYQRKNKLIIIVLTLAAIALIIEASFTIAILFTFIFLILLIIIRYTNKFTFIYIVILAIISLLLFQGAFAVMFKQIANVDKIPPVVSEKLNDLAVYLSVEDAVDTQVDSRISMYHRSIEAFGNNILTGTITSQSSKYISGGHSAWFDLLATFGLFTIPFFLFLYKAYKYCQNRVPKTFRPFINIYWLYFVCLGFVNTLLFSVIYVAWFLFLPLFIVAFFDDNIMA